MYTLYYSGAFEVMYGLPYNKTVLSGENKLRPAGSRHLYLAVLIYVSVGVSRDSYGLAPVSDKRLYPLYDYGSAENRSVKYRAYRAVRTFPHFLEVVLAHSRRVRSDSGAFDSHAVLDIGVCGVHRHLVVGFVSVNKSEIVIFRLQIYKGKKKFFLYRLPKHPCHLVPVHLHKRRGHLDFFHIDSPLTFI